MADLVVAEAPASELAMAILPKGLRPMTQGFCLHIAAVSRCGSRREPSIYCCVKASILARVSVLQPEYASTTRPASSRSTVSGTVSASPLKIFGKSSSATTKFGYVIAGHAFRRGVDTEADEIDPRRLQRRIGALELGHLYRARHAPRRPDVQERPPSGVSHGFHTGEGGKGRALFEVQRAKNSLRRRLRIGKLERFLFDAPHALVLGHENAVAGANVVALLEAGRPMHGETIRLRIARPHAEENPRIAEG